MISQRVLRRALALFYRVQVTGSTGGAATLYVANHPSRLDSLILSLFLPDCPVVVAAPEETKTWWQRALYKLVPHAVLDIRQPRTLRALHKLLDANRRLLLFPEAIAARSFALRKIYEVPAVFAAQSGARVAAVHIERNKGCIALHIRTGGKLDAGQGSAKQRRRYALAQLARVMEQTIVASGPRQTVFEAFLDALETHGRRKKIIEDLREQPETYGRVLKVSLALGRWILGFSSKGEAVGILLPNLATTVCTVLGAQAFARVPAMLNYTAGAAGIRSACVAANIKSIITSRKFLAHFKASSLPAALPEYKWHFLEDVSLPLSHKLWLIAYALFFPRRAIAPQNANSAAVILFTSGSEDRPKGVALSHSALLANIRMMRALVDFSPHDKFLNPLPLYHSYSFTACTLMPLVAGTALFLYPTPLHYRAIPEVAFRKRCTCLFGTGTFLARYAEYAKPQDFAHVRYVIAGGEKLREEVQSLWMEKFGLRILEGYGATECSPVIALNTPNRFRKNTVGNFLPDVEHHLSPVPGIARGGLLHVRGANVMLGYYRFGQPGVLQPAQSEWGERWHCTGDIVVVDAEGFVAIQGRAKRFAKIAGEMVSLEVVESIASRASPSSQHAALAQPDDERGEAIVLFTTDPRLERMMLNRAAQEAGLPTLTLPRKVVHVKELPVLGTGKTDYVQLARTIAKTLAPPAVQRAL